jgi:hypothetical protein
MSRDPEPLDDTALDRALEGLVAVEPSPGFERRAFARAVEAHAVSRPWAIVGRWLLVPAGVGIAIAAAVLLSNDAPRQVVPSVQVAERPQPVTPAPAETRATSEPRPNAPDPRERPPRPPRAPDAARRTPAPEVLISPAEARGMEMLLARAEPLSIQLVDTGAALLATPPRPPDALHVAPIVIEPVSEFRDVTEGVEP